MRDFANFVKSGWSDLKRIKTKQFCGESGQEQW